MNLKEYFEVSSPDEIVERIAALAAVRDNSAIDELYQFLKVSTCIYMLDDDVKHLDISSLACRAFLQRGSSGAELLKNIFLESSLGEYAKEEINVVVLNARSESEAEYLNRLRDIHIEASQYGKRGLHLVLILEALWHAAHGRLLPLPDYDLKVPTPLDDLLSPETINAARQAYYYIAEESQLNERLYEKLILFLLRQFFDNYFSAQLQNPLVSNSVGFDSIRSAVFDLFTEPAIKITRRFIDKFEALINEDRPEEVYQQFLAAHPVFIDPLASQVIPKQKLGLEYVTDYVVRRLDNEHILVEIEKPQDAIFTRNNDFTARFTHAFGQVMDFQQWVDSNLEYARTLMPGITSPKGLLIIGLRKNFTPEQTAKLKRFCINSRSIEIYTFDDLVVRAKDLYSNIHVKVKSDRMFSNTT
jgi:hypothetical protein